MSLGGVAVEAELHMRGALVEDSGHLHHVGDVKGLSDMSQKVQAQSEVLIVDASRTVHDEDQVHGGCAF